MKRFLISVLALLFTFAVIPDGQSQEAPGLEALSGVPVMEGLSEELSQQVIFDKAEGRIIRTVLVGDIDKPQAVSFYREVLFQLGWVEENGSGGMTYTRDEEHLTLSFSDTSPLKVTVDLRPLS